MSALLYQSGSYYKCKVRDGKLLVTHQMQRVAPQVGDCIALGRHYAKACEGVTLDSSGRILELRAPGFETPAV